MKIILLNGPPRCGKDTLAELFIRCFGAAHASFKKRLIEITLCIYGVSREQWDQWYEDKEVPRSALDGKSCRGALIYVSEEVVKLKFGDDYFGKAAAQESLNHLRDGYDYTIFSDSGFPEEAIPLCNLVGPENVMVVRMHRGGTDFSNDSRRYLQPSDLPEGVRFMELENNNHIEETIGFLALGIEEVWP
ncbi:hypothetical protein GCM10023116_01670 [Kistimonas scapharcae]|uniref:Uncharacterized protein n=1 Tax=Kistimonas scapharcae TaxID=1036133 RepID=A0ABP8UXS1_9GAMM